MAGLRQPGPADGSVLPDWTETHAEQGPVIAPDRSQPPWGPAEQG
jgi:hypothetical protein